MASSRRTFHEATLTRQIIGSIAAFIFAAAAPPFSSGAVAAASSQAVATAQQPTSHKPRRR